MQHSLGTMHSANHSAGSLRANGFTIVEVTVVIVVLAILMTIVGVSYVLISDQAREQAVRTDLQTVASSLSKYRADNGAYPTSAVFNSSEIPKSQTSGDTSYTYTYDSGTGSYCLQGTHETTTLHIRNGNAEPELGTC